MEDTEYDGRWTRIEKATFERLVIAADNHFARTVRTVDAAAAGGEQRISDWLNDLEKARTGPFPTAEPGDLLVKLARGEFWSFTTRGWLELAPVYRMGTEPADPTDKPADPQKVTAGGYCGKHGLYQGTLGCLGCAAGDPPREQFFGRSVIEDELDRLRGSVKEGIARGEQILETMRGPLADYAKASASSQGAGCIPETGTIPPPWEPDERQAMILGELDAGITDLEEACDRLSGNLPMEVGMALEESLTGVRVFVSGMRRAKYLVRREMERCYGRQGIA